jgi:hypothetical protein
MLRFLGIGAQKAGTTWLFDRLRRHPEIGFPLGKEAHFWDRPHDEAGVQRYLAAFSRQGECEGDITPAYALLEESTIGRIRAELPELRLVYLLRNPVERAWSSALMALGRAEMTIDEASEQWFLDHFQSRGSLSRGDYAACIECWMRHFPPEQLLLLRYENIKADPESLLARVCRHIGVSPPDTRVLENLREPVFPGPGYPLPPRLRDFLLEFYRPRIAALESMVGEDFSNWFT